MQHVLKAYTYLLQFIGLYDYDPNTSSSNMNPEFELKFKEGSLIKVFGKMMSDGYFIGEVLFACIIYCEARSVYLIIIMQLNGQRGLVPADFIADTSQYQVIIVLMVHDIYVLLCMQKLPPPLHLKSKVRKIFNYV